MVIEQKIAHGPDLAVSRLYRKTPEEGCIPQHF
jgi:hypothetical protein